MRQATAPPARSRSCPISRGRMPGPVAGVVFLWGGEHVLAEAQECALEQTGDVRLRDADLRADLGLRLFAEASQ
jgi:hypothetical protein